MNRREVLTFVTMPGSIPSMPAVARILARYDRSKLEAFIAIAIDLADTFDGDPEAEENPTEDGFVAHDPAFADTDSDGKDTSWPEWQTRGRHKLANGASEATANLVHEDVEDDDPDSGVEDQPEGFDPEEDVGVDDQGCDEDTDMEREQMTDDVPMLPVLSSNYNVFTDQRVSLGISNLQSSFRSSGKVLSADSGMTHQSIGSELKPGVPV